MSLYVYGMMRQEDGVRAVRALDPASLQAVEYADISALVVNVGEGDLPWQERVAGHRDTLQLAFNYGPVLPVRAGTILPDAATLEAELLAPRATALRARLEALEGLSEMQVEFRDTHDSQGLIAALQPLAVAVSVRQPSHERGILSASFLVADDRLSDFDTEAERLSNGGAGNIQLSLIGPTPAYSFAEGRWETEVPSERES